jgi:hypothetical protein
MGWRQGSGATFFPERGILRDISKTSDIVYVEYTKDLVHEPDVPRDIYMNA